MLRRRQWHPTSVLLPGKFHRRRSLLGCSPWGREESDMTEQLPFHFSFSCIGEGNGDLLQCSCLENPRDRGAWWAAISGVAQSQTLLKRLSSSSSSSILLRVFASMFIAEAGHTVRSITSSEQKIHVCHFPSSLTATTTKSLQSCPTLCDPMDGSPPGSPVPGILQARTLEWVAISFSKA